MAVIRGNDNPNVLNGTKFDDRILGYGGDDQLIGFAGNDFAFGGLGDDSLLGNSGNDFLDGGRGSDDIFGGTGADVLFGGAGAETDFLYGGENRDTLYGGQGFDFLDGGSGNDLIIGVNPAGGWTSSVGYSWGLAGVTVDLAAGTATDEFGGHDTLINILDVDATDRDDRITGDERDNFFTPYAGDDSINGGAGLDEVNYNTGGTRGIFANLFTGNVTDNYGDHDRLANVEIIRGTDMNDRIIGGRGSEFFRGLDGDDLLDGGMGYDEVWYDRDLDFGGFGGVEVNLAGGFAVDSYGKLDSLVRIEGVKGTMLGDKITGNGFANTLDGGFSRDSLFGGGGRDELIGGQGNDLINGGAGVDTVSYLSDAADGGVLGVSVNLNTGKAKDGFLGTDRLIGIENARGSNADDTLRGSALANTLWGEGGEDKVYGGGGNDLLIGGAKVDKLWGQGGRDSFGFVKDFGVDRIKDFDAVLGEKLDFTDHPDVNAMGDLAIQQIGTDTRINTGDGLIFLENTDMTDLSAANFIF